MSEKNTELLGLDGKYNDRTREDDHFAHARKVIASWPKWKQAIRIHSVKGLDLPLSPMKREC
ncbi:MAG: hypothetical protein ACTSPI_02345 [Candidatus Heimdallarchaeaceae archaeon]